MDDARARILLESERRRVEGLLGGLREDSQDDRTAADESTNWSDPAQSLTAEGTDDAITVALEDRLRAIERAEERLAAGTYGRSVRSARPIPDERLESDPAAELTVDEAESGPLPTG